MGVFVVAVDWGSQSVGGQVSWRGFITSRDYGITISFVFHLTRMIHEMAWRQFVAEPFLEAMMT